MKKPTQAQMIINHLQKYGSLTQRQAVLEYGIGQPVARIWELRRKGHRIKTTMTDGVNRYNQPCKYAVYTLQPDESDNEKTDSERAAAV